MHRPPKAAGLGAVMLGLLVALLPPAVADARRPAGRGTEAPTRARTADAAELARTAIQAVRAGTTDEACTGWRSTMTPPRTIRVLRSTSPDPLVNGAVQEVDVRSYVETVIAAEWPGSYPIETLKAGAIAVKQYAWYYTIVYRGGVDATGACYDVRDDTIDQWFQPETRTPSPSHLRALDATWGIHLRKVDRQTGVARFMLTGYRAGADVPCGADRDGFRMYQHSMRRCGMDGLRLEQMLRAYLDPRLEIVEPGAHDIVGTELGDLGALVESPGGSLSPRLWALDGAEISAADPGGIDLGAAGLLGWQSGDADADGREDLLVARRTGGRSVRLLVARSDGTGYLDEETWFEGDIGVDPDGGRLLAGDFDGDGRRDAALLVATGGSHATLLLFRHRNGTGFRAPIAWWSGALDLSAARAWSGDTTGDGRSDLIVRVVPPTGTGVRYLTASSPAAGGPLGELRERVRADDLVPGRTHEVIGDADRDGRDDLWLVTGSEGEPTRIELVRSRSGNWRFSRSVAWTASGGQPLPAGRIRVGGGDVDYDGTGDVVVYHDPGDGSTVIMTFDRPGGGAYGTLALTLQRTEPGLDWAALRPY